jgi:hypothetical protein
VLAPNLGDSPLDQSDALEIHVQDAVQVEQRSPELIVSGHVEKNTRTVCDSQWALLQ